MRRTGQTDNGSVLTSALNHYHRRRCRLVRSALAPPASIAPSALSTRLSCAEHTLQCVTLRSSHSAPLHRRHSSLYYLRHRTPTNHKPTASVPPSVCLSVRLYVWLCSSARHSTTIFYYFRRLRRRARCRCDMILMCAIV